MTRARCSVLRAAGVEHGPRAEPAHREHLRGGEGPEDEEARPRQSLHAQLLIDIRSLITDEHLNVIMKDTGKPDPDVWAVGDAAMINGTPLPATAQGAPPPLRSPHRSPPFSNAQWRTRRQSTSGGS